MVFQGVLVYQIIIVIASTLFLFVVSRGKVTTATRLMIVVAFLCLLMNVASLLGLTAKTLDAAVMALKFKYMGAAFLGTFFFIFCAKYCNHPLPPTVQAILQLWNIVVVICVWTSERHNLFFKNLSFENAGILPHVSYENGWLVWINSFLMLAQLVGCVVISILGWKEGRAKKERDSCRIMLICSIFPILAMPARHLPFLQGFEPLSSVVTVSMIAFFLLAYLQDVFDISDVAHENIIANMKEPVIIIDMNYGFVEANDSAEKMFPRLSTNVVGSILSEPALLAYVRTGRMDKLFWEERVYDVHVDRIYDYNQPLGFSILLTDVTANYHQMKKMHRLMTEAKKAEQAKTDFLASMSHEIRTPINSIIGMNEMILREAENQSVKKYAEDVKNAAGMLLSLVNDILDTSKIAAGKLTILPVEYALGDMLLEMYHMTMVRAKQKNLELKLLVDPALPSRYQGDDVRIRQVLINLLTNGVKYTEKGSVTLTVSGTYQKQEAVLLFSVKDTGYGIRKEHLERIFSRFDRVEEEKNRRIEGTGLGLSVSESLLELMGSHLQVHSQVGEGSEFFFELRQPVVDDTPIGSLDEQAGKRQTWKDSVNFTAPEARILLVDDNEMNRRVFVNLLKKTRIQIQEATCGKECLEMVKARHYDMIFLDHMMPEMDGIETLSRMKGMEDNLCNNVPIIMLTANAFAGAREEYLKEGFWDFLAKPIFPEQLEEMVLKYLPEDAIRYVDTI